MSRGKDHLLQVPVLLNAGGISALKYDQDFAGIDQFITTIVL